MAAGFDQVNLAGLMFQQLYDTVESLCFIMNHIDITSQQSKDRIISDGYNSISSIVNIHSNEHDRFKKYLITLNKMYATAGAALQV